ncbi:LuxR family transcriptional regulator [Bradyrhizobium elkanii]|uniref:LuxR family transcriptional regulator n=1 Tax=Bradyrhizobium elkanii TaxID=29448 RepID=UPI001BA60ACB|nr:LuxR family transcriptional regulator [Bradyrhizobium elkanii]MBR1160568.1 LuxR family transcriptional regulator [Bradyrhizobium elkanii]
MHHVFQRFIDLLSAAESSGDFREAIATTAAALDLSCFAYLALPRNGASMPHLISSYPREWTSHYLRKRYQRIDPVIVEALRTPEPFKWGAGFEPRPRSLAQQQLLDEASQFGIRFGFTVPIHDGHGPIAALTFAADHRNRPFESYVTSHSRVLQLMALYFHAHVRRKLNSEPSDRRPSLSPREVECLEWVSRGKSSWEIGKILGISRYTAASYLNSAKEKLGVRTVVQAAVQFAAAKKE